MAARPSRARRALGKLRNSIFHQVTMDVLVRDLSLPYGGGEPLIEIEWHEGTASDIDGLRQAGLHYSPWRIKSAHESFEAGNRFILGVHNSQIVHVAWISYSQIKFRSFTFRLGPSWAYFYDTRTADRFRGNRIHGKGIRKVMDMARGAGAKWAVAFIDEENVISRRNYEREGFRVIARVKAHWALRIRARVSIPAWLQPYLLDEGERPAA
jgi:hypothetical protein